MPDKQQQVEQLFRNELVYFVNNNDKMLSTDYTQKMRKWMKHALKEIQMHFPILK